MLSFENYTSRLRVVIVLAIVTLGPIHQAPGEVLNEYLKLTPDDAAADDIFGLPVAINSETIIVGAYLNDENGADSGAVYLFDRATGTELMKLASPSAAAGHHFGESVAINDTTAVIGARRSTKAYVYDLPSGSERFTLSPLNPEADSFGRSVALSGTLAIVGAENTDSSTGAAYIFDTNTSQQVVELTASDGESPDKFGSSVAIEGDTAFVGAHLDDNAVPNAGSVYMFDAMSGQELMKLEAFGPNPDRFFGRSLAVSDDFLLVGASGDNETTGGAYIFDRTTGEERFKLTPSDGLPGWGFGWSVAIGHGLAIVGAYQADGAAGAAYVFDLATGVELYKLVASDAEAGDWGGGRVAIHGDTVVVGAYLDDTAAGEDAGSAYLFKLPALPGDLNGDGFVGIDDLNIVLSYWNQNVDAGEWLKGDPSGDGFVGITDLNVLLGSWNTGTPAINTAAPEPASLLSLGIAATARLVRRPR